MGALLAHAAKEEGSEGELSHLEPAFVESLKKTSIITSATASCSIEGINVPEQKLAALVNKTISPAKREEHEVLNYKNALDFIFNSTPSKKIQRTRSPITVLFDTSIPDKTIQDTFNSFQKVYGKATWKRADILSRGREITIEGYSPTNLDTFDDLKHASRLADRCLEAQTLQNATRGTVESGRSSGKAEDFPVDYKIPRNILQPNTNTP